MAAERAARRQSDLADLAGATVVVTGAAGGIGSALARAFAAQGANLVLVDLGVESLEDLLDEIDVEAMALAADVTVADEVDGVRQAALERFGQVDVLCNNAGIGGRLGPMWELTDDDWDEVMGVNLRGVVHGVRSFVPGMVARGRGHVVNTASMAGLLPMPFGTPYVASKHAVVGLTATLRWELAQMAKGVSASVLCPGWVRTGIATGPGAGLVEGHQDEPAGVMARMLAANVEAGLDPEVLAAQVVAAVQADEFWILTHADQAAAIVPHYAAAAAAAQR